VNPLAGLQKEQHLCILSIEFRMETALSILLQSRRNDIVRIAKQYGVYNIRIFGSIAVGKADDKSDIDFLVDTLPGTSLFNLGGLLIDLQEMLGCSVDIVTEKGLRKRLRDQVLHEAVPL